MRAETPFAERLLKDAEHEAEKALAQARVEAERVVREAEREARVEASRIIEEAHRKAEEQRKRLISEARRKARLIVSKVKREILDQVFEEAWRECVKALEDEKLFKKTLAGLLLEAVKRLKGDSITVCFPKDFKDRDSVTDIVKDLKKVFPNKSFTVEWGCIKTVCGALVRTGDGRIWVEATLETRYEAVKRISEAIISRRLFNGEDV